MNQRLVTKRGISIYYVAYVILTFKSTVLSVRFGADELLIGDINKTTIDFDSINSIDQRFTINTKGCMIPLVDGNNSLTKTYHNVPSRLPVCLMDKHPLLTSNETHIITVKENLRFYKNVNNKSDVLCCYQAFYRPRSSVGVSNNSVDNRISYRSCKMFKDYFKVTDEFVKVNCEYKNKRIYSKFFVFTLKKTFTTLRANPFPNNQSLYNVLIMGLGSISRQNFYRTMPKTWELLKRMEAVELKGYNAIAKDTFQNLMGLLIGMNVTQLRNVCWPNRLATLDSCPFIWERFKDVGYYTALAEDSAKLGIFNTETFGFRGTPTDYYIHPFIHESERLTKQREYDTCIGDKYYFEVLLNYIDNLTTKLNNSNLFGLFWEISMSYNNLKYPKKLDGAYATLINKLNTSGYLNKTIIILLSDHGMNIGDTHFTKQGRLEQRLPLAYIITPNRFRQVFKIAYNNLKLNGDRLTSPYDLHTTLLDLLDLNEITDSEIATRSTEAYGQDRGISLFLKVPLNRTCPLAGIHKKFCTCYKSVKMREKNPLIPKAIKFVSQHINQLLNSYPNCLRLSINKIVNAYELVPGYERNEEWRSFMIVISTIPGGGVFEAMLQYKENKHFSLLSPIKRLNNSSRNDCVSNEYIKVLCYCNQ